MCMFLCKTKYFADNYFHLIWCKSINIYFYDYNLLFNWTCAFFLNKKECFFKV